MDKNILYVPETATDYQNIPSAGQLLVQSLTADPDKVLLVSGITSEEVTAGELLKKAYNVANSLRALGLKSGDVLSIVSENRFEFAFTLFGCMLENITVAPINLTYSEREMTHALTLSKPRIVIMSPFACEKVIAVTNALSFVQKVVLFEDENPFGDRVMLFGDFLKLSNDRQFVPAPVADRSKAIALILCSSGTTGIFFCVF
jgi:4-coumarate--CoA ligase